MFKRSFCTVVLSFSVAGWAQPVSSFPIDAAFNDSIRLLFANLNRTDVASGAVIASPSKDAPNYFYHWVRDAALTHDALFQLYQQTTDAKLKANIRQQARDWIDFETLTQKNSQDAEAGLGEPRFYVDGDVNTLPWGRPQFDGPAARAITMTEWAFDYLARGDSTYVTENLYRADLPATSVLKKDLEYVSYHWQDDSYDLWEEVKGVHFYTLAIERRALLLGSQLADRMNDPGAAAWYRAQAKAIKTLLLTFIDPARNYIIATLTQSDGWTHKLSNLDIAVVIAANHALIGTDEIFSEAQPQLTSTIENLETRFAALYPINQDRSVGVALGRYPEDVYDGAGFGGGNPWFIATNAAAEFYCRLGREIRAKGGSELDAAPLFARGLKFFERTLKHRNQDTGELTEQFSRDTGFEMGAHHLTWSYASYITAYLACKQ